MEEGHVPLAWLNPSIPISWPGRVLRTPAGPLTSRLPPDTSGVRRHLSVDLEAHFLVVPDLAVVPTPPRPGRFARRGGGVQGWTMLPSARITWRVNMRIICRREALERASDVEGRRRRPGLRLLCVSGSLARPSLDECDNPTLCALRSASQNKVLSCWEIAVAGCGRSRIVK